jgi:hypothetical protein
MSCKSCLASVGAFAATCIVALGAGPANANSITETIDFTAANFVTTLGSGTAPVDPVTGSFTITLEPTMAPIIGGTTVTLNSLNITPNAANALFFNYGFGHPGELELCSSPAQAVQQSRGLIAFFCSSTTSQALQHSQTSLMDNRLHQTANLKPSQAQSQWSPAPSLVQDFPVL